MKKYLSYLPFCKLRGIGIMFGLFKKSCKKSPTLPSVLPKYRVIEKTTEERQKARDIKLTLINGKTVTYTSKSYLYNDLRTDTVNLITGKKHSLYQDRAPREALATIRLLRPNHLPPEVPSHNGMLRVVNENGHERFINMAHVISIDAKPVYETEEVLKATYDVIEKIPEGLE